jgi:hypothetical protein
MARHADRFERRARLRQIALWISCDPHADLVRAQRGIRIEMGAEPRCHRLELSALARAREHGHTGRLDEPGLHRRGSAAEGQRGVVDFFTHEHARANIFQHHVQRIAAILVDERIVDIAAGALDQCAERVSRGAPPQLE